MKRTPLYDCHLRLGAQMTDFGGFEMPIRYSGDKIEHMAVREKVGLFDVSHMGEILIAGPKAEEDVNRLLSNDAAKIQNGQAFYAAMLNADGKIIDDVVAYKFSPEKFIICVNASNREKDFKWIHENCNYAKDVSDNFAQIAVQGPRAINLVDALSPKEARSLKRYHFAEGKLQLETQSTDAIIARTGYTGEDGFELYVSTRDATKVWETLFKVGSPWGVTACGLAARDTLRLEAGM
jgi:aminomethyltransferase